jgi:Txe/YoeB family toxin of Txe-Axe toxin-antitoxin module
MAKITVYIPEPKEQYEVSNQRQITASLETLKDQLKFCFSRRNKTRSRKVYLVLWLIHI